MFLPKPNRTPRPRFDRLRRYFEHETQEVEVKQIQMAFLASTKNLAAGGVAVLIIGIGIWSIPSPSANRALLPYLGAWACATTFFLMRGIYLAKQFMARAATREETLQHGRRLATNGAFAGVLWGSSSLLILNSANIQQSTFLICSIGLVIMGGAGAQAQYGRLVNMFVCSTTAMFVCGILVNPVLTPLIAVGFLLYAAVSVECARQQQASVKEIIELNIENERLLVQARDSMQALERARTEAEMANRAKTRFLAATSHDLRQPMHALSLYVAHLRRFKDAHDFIDTLDKVDAATGAMKDLLDAVLDLSRISLGAVKPDIRPVELNDVLQRVAMQLTPQADAKGLRLSIAPCHAVVKTDAILLERIFRNIVLNAIRYTRSGQVIVRAVRRGTQVIVRIADTGVGIPRSEQAHVFEEFYQLNNSERDRKKGLGLGLAIVAQLGLLLAHPVSFRSRVGRGSIFRVTLEAATATRGAPLAMASTMPDDFVSGSAVLVIDDDPLVLDSMKCTLQDMGCHVMAAASVLEALERVGGEARVPDLIVSDYRLRDRETGIDAIRILRENLHGDEAPRCPIPGLIISGDTSPEELNAVSQEGLVMLHKPVAPQLLRARMNALLEAYAQALCAPVDREA